MLRHKTTAPFRTIKFRIGEVADLELIELIFDPEMCYYYDLFGFVNILGRFSTLIYHFAAVGLTCTSAAQLVESEMCLKICSSHRSRHK